MCTIRELSNSIQELSNWIAVSLIFLCLNEIEGSLIQLESSVIEFESSLIPTFFLIAGVLPVLVSSLIELESSLIYLQSSANELVRSLIVHIYRFDSPDTRVFPYSSEDSIVGALRRQPSTYVSGQSFEFLVILISVHSKSNRVFIIELVCTLIEIVRPQIFQ